MAYLRAIIYKEQLNLILTLPYHQYIIY